MVKKVINPKQAIAIALSEANKKWSIKIIIYKFSSLQIINFSGSILQLNTSLDFS